MSTIALLLIYATLSLQQEPVEAPPTPKRPRGRPKGSKNKGSSRGRVSIYSGVWTTSVKSSQATYT